MFCTRQGPLLTIFLMSCLYFNSFIWCINFFSVSITNIMLPISTEMMYFTARRISSSAFPLIIAFDRYIKPQLIQPTSLYVPDGARHLSFWLQLVLRERRIRSKFRILVTVIYCELYEGGNQFSKLPRLIHNYGHKPGTAVLTVQSCRDSDRVTYLLRMQGTELRFPNARGFVSTAYSRFRIHNK
jgi:hypothetical protein